MQHAAFGFLTVLQMILLRREIQHVPVREAREMLWAAFTAAKLEAAPTVSNSSCHGSLGPLASSSYGDASHGSRLAPWGAPSLLRQIVPVGIFSRCAA